VHGQECPVCCESCGVSSVGAGHSKSPCMVVCMPGHGVLATLGGWWSHPTLCFA
jgi:hypothetical protein